MTVELGHLALILAFVVAVVQMVVPMVGAARGWSDWMRLAVPAATVQFIMTFAAFAVLMHAFAVSDFSVRLVALNSNSAQPLIYRIAGTWGNHEGSMLLWMLILTLFGAMVAWWGGNLPPSLRARVLSVQATIAVAFFGFILLTSNPFIRLANPPIDGNDLNPLLQDPGLAFHPPFLYLGYVGLSMAYSFAIAALIEGRVDAAWARWVRPWTLLAWVFLTIGIAMGSVWSYYELGWGGWWAWDPVENVSFMPWLISAALLHSAIVVEKRGTLKSWTILLAILAFSFSLIGAFIVRSGILTSVHTFADDPERGVYLLWILGAFIGGSLMLYAWRAPVLRSDSAFALVSRESGLVLNNLLLVVATLVVFFGTMWPLLAEVLTGRKVSVGPPFFNLAFTPFMVALAVDPAALRHAALEARQPRPRDAAALGRPGALGGARGAGLGAADRRAAMLAPVGAALAAWLVLGAAAEIASRVRLRPRAPRREPPPRAQPAARRLGQGARPRRPRHLDLRHRRDHRLVGRGHPRSSTQATASRSRGYELRFDGVAATRGPNYGAQTGTVTAFRDGREIGTLHPEKRALRRAGAWRPPRPPSTAASTRDLYVALGDRRQGDGWALRTYVKPFANWIWARRADHGRRRHRQPDRPPLPRRRPRPPRRSRRGGSGGVGRCAAACSRSSLCLAPLAAHAVQPDEVLADPALEARARGITKELRCVVCQSESIDESEADIARDLRLLVRERLLAGDTDDEVRAFVVARYGEFVLFRPPIELAQRPALARRPRAPRRRRRPRLRLRPSSLPRPPPTRPPLTPDEEARLRAAAPAADPRVPVRLPPAAIVPPSGTGATAMAYETIALCARRATSPRSP